MMFHKRNRKLCSYHFYNRPFTIYVHLNHRSGINDVSDLGSADESSLLILVGKLRKLIGSQRRFCDTCNITANNFTAWIKNRSYSFE